MNLSLRNIIQIYRNPSECKEIHRNLGMGLDI